MGVGEYKAPFAVDNHTGTQAGALLTPLKSGIKEVFKKFFEKRIHTKTGERIGALADLIG